MSQVMGYKTHIIHWVYSEYVGFTSILASCRNMFGKRPSPLVLPFLNPPSKTRSLTHNQV